MIAYFYERSSDGLHRYMAPAPSASTINRTYAVSNGYLIFVPDIPYVEGYPGHSAYNAVVSGTYAMSTSLILLILIVWDSTDRAGEVTRLLI